MSYDDLRHMADSWGLLYMLAIFVGVAMMLLRPGARKQADDAAKIPFKEDR